MIDTPIERHSARSFARTVRRAAVAIASIVAAGLFGLVGVLLLWSYPGKPKPLLDQNGKPIPGSISEKMYVTINGVQQGMFIKGRSTENPVLLYLHGGMPDYFLTQRYPTGLEDDFTVVWWEQRGAGISYSADIPPSSLTAEQFVSDTLELTNYLRQRFGKEKIYLMGHSGGTFIGIQAAARAPELYYAYIGVAQISNQLKSEQLAYDYMLQQFKQSGNTDMARKLEAAPVSLAGGTPQAYLAVRDEAMHSLGIGTMHTMRSVASGIFLESLQNHDYTLPEKIRMWRAKATSGVGTLWSTVVATDLSKQVPELRLPVYFFHGTYDYTCSYSEARAYFAKLKAPVKGFYTFEQSAHSPMFEEPARVRQILRADVLTGATNLADAK